MNQKEIKVLVIDDEVAFANTLAQRLSMRDMEVFTAYDGETALSKLREKTADVIILDLKMPGMNGMDVLQEIKASYPDIQVIMLTGHGTDRDAEEARILGGFDFLNKPADIDHLERRIRRAFQEKLEKPV
jgi:DNA-binding NtrC family response regulator